jgi:asparagine synthase (glutamine-hydrolysing)
MCGIGGAFAVDPQARPDVDRVARMSEMLAHRGPDGHGMWCEPAGRAVLAHRRLSIIDLATGQQPMTSADGRSAIVFNGEIYNYKELRRELEQGGTRFRTESDTEVLLDLLGRRGSAGIEPLRGMFAFAYWDAARERFMLVRDRLGKKPLYYVVEGGCLYFASSLRALRATAPRRWEIDIEAVDAYLSLGYIPAPRTIFREVRKLPAATVLEVDAGGWRERRFWDLRVNDAPFEGSYHDAVDRTEEILQTAVAIRLRSDVPLGVFLSGGIDSSLVTAVAARVSSSPIRTFSIGFDTRGFDESVHAAAIAAHLGTQHRTIPVQTDVLELLPQMADHYGEPFADSSALPTWMLAQATRRHVTVALGGDGGDEGFAGYNWYAAAARLTKLGRLIPTGAAKLGSRTLARVGAGSAPGAQHAARIGRGLSMVALDDEAERFAALRLLTGRKDARTLYAGALAAARGDSAGAEQRAMAELYERCDGSALRRMRYTDIQRYLADCLLPKVDVATMAHGLEARAPLLDHELIEFAMSLPDEYLLGEGGGKRILRTLLARYVPAPLFERPKQGFDPPLAAWFAGPLRSRVSALADSQALLGTGWFQRDGIVTMVREHVDGRRDHGDRLFSLLVLEEWLNRC